jgi:Leucine-rich repeat (LRR) protein
MTYLNMGCHNLNELSESIGQLSNLVDLRLDENHFTTVPKSLGQLINFRYLDVSNNDLNGLAYIEIFS